MGLRSRLRESVKSLLGREAPPPPHQPSPPPAALRPAPAPRPEPRIEPAIPPTPVVIEHQAVVAPIPLPEPVVPVEPEPPAPMVEARSVEPTPEAPRAMSIIELVNSNDHADAPVRNAHYAAQRETTEAALRVRVYNKAEGLDVTFSVEPGEYVLDAAERAGFLLPFSCRAGGCLTCSAKTEGEVRFEMGEQYVLDDDIVAQGYCLLCCTSVSTNAVFLSHQQDNIG